VALRDEAEYRKAESRPPPSEDQALAGTTGVSEIVHLYY
jgi:hypothetical protein